MHFCVISQQSWQTARSICAEYRKLAKSVKILKSSIKVSQLIELWI